MDAVNRVLAQPLLYLPLGARPEEPMSESIPRWGRVVAAPHEYLVHVRRGRVIAAGQGGSCFRWPSDSVALVDTSVQRLQFTADQITREKVGVQVTGLAVFRIVAPLLAYRTLHLGENEQHTTILREMFVGATRRLVANLSLEECLTRRKDALAGELVSEVAPVVEGTGRAEDDSDKGWGIAIDTIEIQDVRVLSAEVFANLQATFREELEMRALHAQAEVEEEKRKLALLHAEHQGEMARRANESKIARDEAAAVGRVAVAEREAQAARIRGAAEAEVLRVRREAEAAPVSPERLQEVLLTETLPRVAEAFRESFDQVVVTGGEMDFLGTGLAQVLATARAFGVALPGVED